MTMYVYSGTPGSGKSLHAASEIRFNLNRKSNPRPVIANFNLAPTAKIAHPECFTYVPNNELTPQYLMEYAIDYWAEHEFKEVLWRKLIVRHVSKALWMGNLGRWSQIEVRYHGARVALSVEVEPYLACSMQALP